MNKCPHCKKTISAYAITCPNCGCKIDISTSNNEVIPRKTLKDKAAIKLEKVKKYSMQTKIVISCSTFVFILSSFILCTYLYWLIWIRRMITGRVFNIKSLSLLHKMGLIIIPKDYLNRLQFGEISKLCGIMSVICTLIAIASVVVIIVCIKKEKTK